MADSRTRKLSMNGQPFYSILFEPDEIKDGKAKSAIFEEIKNYTVEDMRHKEDCVVFDCLPEKSSGAWKGKSNSVIQKKNSSRKENESGNNNTPSLIVWDPAIIL